MIDLLTIFTRGGLVLWSLEGPQPIPDHPMQTLLTQVLCKARAQQPHRLGNHAFSWTRDNSHDLLIVAGYIPFASAVLSVEELLEGVRKEFVGRFGRELCVLGSGESVPDFEGFAKVYEGIEKEFRETMRVKSRRGKGIGGKKMTKENNVKQKVEKKGKAKRDWNRVSGKEDGEKRLVYGQDKAGEEEQVSIDLVSSDDEYEETLDETISSGSLSSYFSTLLQGTQLTEANLSPYLDKIRDQLLAKNVAVGITDQICASVLSSLLHKHVSSLSSFTALVRQSTHTALTSILSPAHSLDLLRDVRAKRASSAAVGPSKPYTIVFVGVNGVGKSTTLSKVCYYLLARGVQVSMAACDTFRAGAVEQLRTHGRRLGVEVFEQGYNKDASSVAAAAVRKASERGDEVVLIDTAGRMQENEPLMRSLAKLVKVNAPDLVLFVGEALTGNDAVDQVVKFNQALEDFGGSQPRLIDGIVLTKFDAIQENKVGAAVSMTFTTGQPIVFVGVGQHYADLRKLSVQALVNRLLS